MALWHPSSLDTRSDHRRCASAQRHIMGCNLRSGCNRHGHPINNGYDTLGGNRNDFRLVTLSVSPRYCVRDTRRERRQGSLRHNERAKMTERWKVIKGFYHYEVSDFGRIRVRSRTTINRLDVRRFHKSRLDIEVLLMIM